MLIINRKIEKNKYSRLLLHNILDYHDLIFNFQNRNGKWLTEGAR